VKSLRSSTAIRKPARTLPRVGAMNTTRTSLVIAAAAAGLLAAAGPAQADPLPTTPQTFKLPGTNDVGDAGYCPFPVTIQYSSVQKVTETTLPNGGEEFRFTGHAQAIVTNDNTGKSITYNASGPGTQTFFSFPRTDVNFTIDAAGPNVLWTTRGNSARGVPQIAYTTGRVQVTVDENGHTTGYQLNGSSTDVCAKLAAA
jgi:hypothetical protein